jgi:hypothetical protein
MGKLISLTFLHVTASTALSASKKAYNFFWELQNELFSAV